jgi:hypothetical protein
MNITFEVGQIVREAGKRGSPEYCIKGFALNMIKAEQIADSTVDFFLPDQLELLEYTCNTGSYRVGDTVRLFGIEGVFIVDYFYETAEGLKAVCAQLANPEVRIAMTAHYVKKA